MQARKPTRFNVDYWRAESALNWIEGSLDETRISWEKSHAMVEQLPQAGAYDFSRAAPCSAANSTSPTRHNFVRSHINFGGTWAVTFVFCDVDWSDPYHTQRVFIGKEFCEYWFCENGMFKREFSPDL